MEIKHNTTCGFLALKIACILIKSSRISSNHSNCRNWKKNRFTCQLDLINETQKNTLSFVMVKTLFLFLVLYRFLKSEWDMHWGGGIYLAKALTTAGKMVFFLNRLNKPIYELSSSPPLYPFVYNRSSINLTVMFWQASSHFKVFLFFKKHTCFKIPSYC